MAATLAPPPARAAELASRHWRRNREHLTPALRDRLDAVDNDRAVACFGRDGSLTARVNGAWLGGSSVPSLVAAALLERTMLPTDALCIVAPNHAQHVVVTLDALPPSASLLAIWSDLAALAFALRCADFADALAGGRLHLLGPDEVGDNVRRLADDRPGWAVPKQIIIFGDSRAVQNPETIQALQESATTGLREAAEDRATAVSRVAADGLPQTADVALLAGLRFHPLDRAGQALAATLEHLEIATADFDHPDSASTLAAARAAAAAPRVVAADLLRHDLPGVVAEGKPWLTWVTRPRPAVPWRAGPDAVLLAHSRWSDDWLAAGWPKDRVTVGRWPSRPRVATGEGLLLIADLPPREPPKDVADYSSASVLWDQVASEIAADPWLPARSPRWLADQFTAAGVSGTEAQLARWTRDCVQPAIARGLAAALAETGRSYRIVGTGWDGEAGAVGPVENADGFDRLLAGSRALVDPTLAGDGRYGSLGLPVVGLGASRDAWLRSLSHPTPLAADDSLAQSLAAFTN